MISSAMRYQRNHGNLVDARHIDYSVPQKQTTVTAYFSSKQ